MRGAAHLCQTDGVAVPCLCVRGIDHGEAEFDKPVEPQRPVGFVKHNGCGEILFRQAGHPSNDPEPPWRPVHYIGPVGDAAD